MQEFYIVARPSPIDLMRNQFPHNNPLAKVTVTTSLAEAISASQINMPDKSTFEETLSHLKLPQAMIFYCAQGDASQIAATAGNPQETTGSIFKALSIKDVEVMLSDDVLHRSEAQKSEKVDDVCRMMSDKLWSRAEKLEKYTQAVNMYSKTPPEAWQIWFKNVEQAEQGRTWHVPYTATSYFNMYYELSPFTDDVKRSAQYATAKTAINMRASRGSGMQALVLRALEDNAMNAVKNVSSLYGHQMPQRDYEQQILQYTLPLLQNIYPTDREAFVKGVQTSGEIWSGLPAEDIFMEAYHGFKRNHPGYETSLDKLVQDVVKNIHSPVPMMVFGYWEGAMQQTYQCGIDDEVLSAYKETFAQSTGYSEMRKIGEAIEAAQDVLKEQGYALYDLPSGMDVAQKFTNAHLSNGMYTPVCFAWVPDDIRAYAENTFQQQSASREVSGAMLYALAAALTKCDKNYNSANMMRDISTVMNEVTMQVASIGVDPRDISAVLNEAFRQENEEDIADDSETRA